MTSMYDLINAAVIQWEADGIPAKDIQQRRDELVKLPSIVAVKNYLHLKLWDQK